MDNLNYMKTLNFLFAASFVITSEILNAQVTPEKEFLKLEQSGRMHWSKKTAYFCQNYSTVNSHQLVREQLQILR